MATLGGDPSGTGWYLESEDPSGTILHITNRVPYWGFGNKPPWYEYRENIVYVRVHSWPQLLCYDSMFEGFINLKQIQGMNNIKLETELFRNMEYNFPLTELSNISFFSNSTGLLDISNKTIEITGDVSTLNTGSYDAPFKFTGVVDFSFSWHNFSGLDTEIVEIEEQDGERYELDTEFSEIEENDGILTELSTEYVEVEETLDTQHYKVALEITYDTVKNNENLRTLTLKAVDYGTSALLQEIHQDYLRDSEDFDTLNRFLSAACGSRHGGFSIKLLTPFHFSFTSMFKDCEKLDCVILKRPVVDVEVEGMDGKYWYTNTKDMFLNTGLCAVHFEWPAWDDWAIVNHNLPWYAPFQDDEGWETEDYETFFKGSNFIYSIEENSGFYNNENNQTTLYSGSCGAILERIQNTKNIVCDYDSDINIKSQDFKELSQLTQVDFTLAKNITISSLEESFKGCLNLKEILFSDDTIIDVTQLNNASSAFMNCKVLTTLDLPIALSDIKSMLVSMFDGCTKLYSIKMLDWKLAPTVLNISRMFYKCSSLDPLFSFPSVNSQVIADEVMAHTSIVEWTFEDWYRFNSHNYFFNNCDQLRRINLNGITQQLTGLFKNCNNLNIVNLIFENDKYVITDASEFLYNCNNLQKVSIGFKDAHSTQMYIQSAGQNGLYGIPLLQSIQKENLVLKNEEYLKAGIYFSRKNPIRFYDNGKIQGSYFIEQPESLTSFLPFGAAQASEIIEDRSVDSYSDNLMLKNIDKSQASSNVVILQIDSTLNDDRKNPWVHFEMRNYNRMDVLINKNPYSFIISSVLKTIQENEDLETGEVVKDERYRISFKTYEETQKFLALIQQENKYTITFMHPIELTNKIKCNEIVEIDDFYSINYAYYFPLTYGELSEYTYQQLKEGI